MSFPPGLPRDALVWKRNDYSESSRLVVLLTRTEGKLRVLAKGAHRLRSPLMGRIDLWNLVEPRLARSHGRGLVVLHDVELLHEHRGLRAPRRYTAACHIADVVDPAFPDGRPDPELFEVLVGALRLLERCPEPTLPTAVVGIELKLLRALGLLPDLDGCSVCGERDCQLFAGPRGEGGLLCPRHRSPAASSIAKPALAWLQRLDTTPARSWVGLHRLAAGEALVGAWVAAAIERRPRWRTQVL